MSQKVEIEAEITGAEEVVQGLKKIGDAELERAKKAKEAAKIEEQARKEADKKRKDKEKEDEARDERREKTAKEVMKDIARGVAEMGLSYAAASIDLRKVDFKEAKDEAAAFDESLTRLSLRGTEGFSKLRENTLKLSEGIGVDVHRITQAATILSDTTYSEDGMTAGVEAAGKAANEYGKQMEDMLPLAVALGKSFGASGEQIASGFEKVKDLAQNLGTVGGVRAFQDTIAGLGPVFQQLGIQTDQARNKVMAFVGILGQGLNKDQAQQVGGQALSYLEGINPLMLARTLRKKIPELYDEHGNLRDKPGTMQALKQHVTRHWGKNRTREVLMYMMGNKLGSEVALKDISQVDAIAEQKGPENTNTPNFLKTPAGFRQYHDVFMQNATRKKYGDPALLTSDHDRRMSLKDPEQRLQSDTLMSYMPGFLQKGWTALRYLEADAERQETLSFPFSDKNHPVHQKRNGPAAQVALPSGRGDRSGRGEKAIVEGLKRIENKTATAKQIGDEIKNIKIKQQIPQPLTQDVTEQNKQAGDVNR